MHAASVPFFVCPCDLPVDFHAIKVRLLFPQTMDDVSFTVYKVEHDYVGRVQAHPQGLGNSLWPQVRAVVAEKCKVPELNVTIRGLQLKSGNMLDESTAANTPIIQV